MECKLMGWRFSLDEVAGHVAPSLVLLFIPGRLAAHYLTLSDIFVFWASRTYPSNMAISYKGIFHFVWDSQKKYLSAQPLSTHALYKQTNKQSKSQWHRDCYFHKVTLIKGNTRMWKILIRQLTAINTCKNCARHCYKPCPFIKSYYPFCYSGLRKEIQDLIVE